MKLCVSAHQPRGEARKIIILEVFVSSYVMEQNLTQRHPSAGTNGKFWYVSSSGLVCSDGEKPEDFFLEFVEHGRIAIKGSNGKYLRGDQGGTLMGDGTTIDASSLWEYWFLSVSLPPGVGKTYKLGVSAPTSIRWNEVGLWGGVKISCLFLY